jgi:hypothetical protein
MDHAQILEVTCLQFRTWDQVLMLPHLRLRVIYQALQVIWQAVPLSIQPLEWRHNLLKVQVKVVTMMGQHP